MVRLPRVSKQMATASNDSMVFVWNLNQTGNIYKYIGHRVHPHLCRTLSPMSSSLLLATNLPPHPKIKLLKYGPTTPKATPSPSKLTMLPFEHLTTAMMANFYSPALMTKPSKFIALRIKNCTSPSLATRTGLRLPASLPTTDSSVLVARTKQSSYGIRSLKRCSTTSMTTSALSTTASSTLMALA